MGLFLILVGLVMGGVALHQIKTTLRCLTERVEILELRAQALAAPPVQQAEPELEPDVAAPPLPTVPSVLPVVTLPPWEETATVVTPEDSLEQKIGARWLVWLGGVSLVIGGAFFVRYAMVQGWLTPVVRLILAALAGGALMGVGDRLGRQSHFRDLAGRVLSLPQALSAGGAGVLFATVFAAHALYGFLSQPVALLGLLTVCGLTVALSLTQGVIMAILGLIGAYAVPALVGDRTGSVTALLVYLTALGVMTEGLAYRKGWPVISRLGLIASVIWGVPLVFAQETQVVFFALAMLGLYLVQLERRVAAASLMVALMVAGLPFNQVFDPLMVLAAGAGFALPFGVSVWRRLPVGEVLAAALALGVALHTGVPEGFPQIALALICALVLLLNTARDPLRTDALSQIAALAPLVILGAVWGVASDFGIGTAWVVLFVGFTIVAGGLHLWSARGQQAAAPLPGILLAQAAGGAILGAAAHFSGADLLFVLTLYLPVLAWLALRTPLLARVLVGLAVFVPLCVALSGDVLLHPIVGEAGLRWMLQTLLVPVGAGGLALWLLRNRPQTFPHTVGVLICSVQIHAALFLFALVRWAEGRAGALPDLPFSLRESALIALVWMVCSVGTIALPVFRKNVVGQTGAMLLAVLAFLVSLFGPVLLRNPLVTGEPVGALPLLNDLLLAYALPALVLGFTAFRVTESRPRKVLGIVALCYLLIWISLTVRHAFHGPVLTGATSQAEWYAYSAAWLVTGFALLLAGTWQRRQVMRQAGLGVVLLTVAKVFASDVWSLSGLLQVASVTGLAMALLGTGYLYQRYDVRDGKTDRDSSGSSPGKR